ncbi:1727_t:CDS:1, partial [Dentiscutata erythropus]
NAFPYRPGFQACSSPSRTSPLSVSVLSDSFVSNTFNITGTLTKPITPDYLLYIKYIDITVVLPAVLNQVFVTQIPTGTSVNVVEKVSVPDGLPINLNHLML